MKLASVALLSILFSCVGWTQEKESVIEPEFADVFFSLDDAGKLISLERQAAATQVKVSGFLIVNGKGIMTFPGASSPVRFHAGELAFVVRSQTASSDIDPTDLYHLRKFTIKKKQREVVLSIVRVSPVGASVNRQATGDTIPFKFSRYGNSSIRINVSGLAPGEYVIGRANGQAVFCFGVD